MSFIEADILFQAFFEADAFKQIHLMNFFVGSRFYFGFKQHTLVGIAILTAAALPLLQEMLDSLKNSRFTHGLARWKKKDRIQLNSS